MIISIDKEKVQQNTAPLHVQNTRELWVFNKGVKTVQWRKGIVFTKWCTLQTKN